MPRRMIAVGVGAVLILLAGCGSDEVATPTETPSSTEAPTTTTEPIAPSSTSSTLEPAPEPPVTVSTSSPTTTATPPTVGASAGSGAPLAEILEPYETRALTDTMFTSYRFSCWPYSGPQGSAWIDWEREEVDRNGPVSRGAVLTCLPRTDPPADSGHMDLIVLDDHGTITWWWKEATRSLTCRPPRGVCSAVNTWPQNAKRPAMAWVGASPPWNDDVLAYQWALAYWFLEDEPDRIDVDGNGVPCELLFDQEVIAEVWAGNTR